MASAECGVVVVVLAPVGYYSKFGLSVEHDEDLSDWMRGRLRLALWPCGDVPDLDCVETGVLEKMQPPLNLDKVMTPWRDQVRAERIGSSARR